MQSVGLRLLSEVKTLEASCLLQLRHLDNDAKAVVDFLKLQSRKIDLVLQHVLEKEIQEGDKFLGSQFGGSGISVTASKPLTVGEKFKTYLYLHAELVAVLCICRVSDCRQIENNEASSDSWYCELEFDVILDEDVEQLVKASLNVQQKMLKLRKQQQNNS